jgi:membrane protein YqaA with SNARE-associated domain
MKIWLKQLYTRSLQLAGTKWSLWALFFCAFADASFLPLPTPMFFLTLTLLNIAKAYKYALFVTLGTLVGAVAGYSIGYFAWLNANGEFTRLAQFLLENIPGFSETAYNTIQVQYAKWDFGLLFIASLLPVPYKIFSISSGVFDINIFMFCFATLISQGAKYYILALLAIKIGPKVKELLKFRIKTFALFASACIVVAIVVIRVL